MQVPKLGAFCTVRRSHHCHHPSEGGAGSDTVTQRLGCAALHLFKSRSLETVSVIKREHYDAATTVTMYRDLGAR